MPAIAELGKPFRFTPENAKAKQAAGVAARLARKKLANSSQIPVQVDLSTANFTVNGFTVSEQASRLMDRMDSIERQMIGLTSAGKLLQLSLAYSKLFAAWQTLVGLEKPATRKRGKQRGDAPTWNGNGQGPQMAIEPEQLPQGVVSLADPAQNNSRI